MLHTATLWIIYVVYNATFYNTLTLLYNNRKGKHFLLYIISLTFGLGALGFVLCALAEASGPGPGGARASNTQHNST